MSLAKVNGNGEKVQTVGNVPSAMLFWKVTTS